MQTGKWQGYVGKNGHPPFPIPPLAPATQVSLGEQGRKYDIFHDINPARIPFLPEGLSKVRINFKLRLILVTTSDIYVAPAAALDIQPSLLEAPEHDLHLPIEAATGVEKRE